MFITHQASNKKRKLNRVTKNQTTEYIQFKYVLLYLYFLCVFHDQREKLVFNTSLLAHPPPFPSILYP
jgi:hypothetical protein